MSTVEGKSDRELRKTVRACERTLERLSSVDVKKAVRDGKADALLAEAERAVASSRAASEELGRRASATSRSRGRLPASLIGLIPTRNTVPSGSHSAAAALHSVAAFGHPELAGAVLRASSLTYEEGVELSAFVKQLGTGGAGAELTSEERGRYEQLLGKCAGNENLFAERRREASARNRLSELTDEAKKASLPLRVKYEQPDAVVLPALVFDWLKSSREASWTVADVGVLAVVLGMFANRDASLIVGARFEEHDGDLILIVPEDIVFRPDANPHPMQGGAGQVNPAVALATLRRNRFIEVVRGEGTFRISLPPRS